MKTTFVLVHGAWLGGVVWRLIAEALRSKGHVVYTPTLTGLGERKHLLSRQVDLDTHIQDVLGLIDEEDLSDLVLVGHSYGGMVVTGVADAIPDKIASLVYLDAFIPENGKALVAVASGRPGTARPSLIRSLRVLRLLLRAVLRIPGAVWLAPVPPLESIGEPSEAFRDFVARKASPHPLACFTQASKLTGGIERIRRKTYIYCNDPQPTTFTPLYEKLRHEPGWTVHTLPCSHWAQLDMPEALTALLLRHTALD